MKLFILLAVIGTVFGGLDEPSGPTPTPSVESTCERVGKTYGLGESVPGRNPCEVGCFCAPQGQINCAIIDCVPITCGDFHPIQDPNLCCKVCPKCEINGTVYEPGDNLPVRDPCNRKCVCDRNGRISCEIIATSCPIAVCAPGFTQHVEQNPGQCCPNVTCVPNTCEVDGRSYGVGDDIPTDNPCETCACIEGGDQSCAKIFCDIPSCGNGLQSIARDDECCPSCRCVVNGTAYDVGDSVPSDNACNICDCTESGLACASISCPPPLVCPPFHELVVRPVEGECCPEQMCSQRCPPPCTRKLCKSNVNALCSTPSGGSCVSACNVTTCKACYYSEEPPRSLPTGCEKYNCESVKDDANRLSNCLKRFGRCIGKQDRKQYGKPESSIVRPRNFKCYAYPCGE